MQLFKVFPGVGKRHLLTYMYGIVNFQDDPEIPFTEEDYRRRRPHPNFKEHISAEKTVMKFGKTNKAKLVTYVVAAGLTYGCGEHIFHYLFKVMLMNKDNIHIKYL